MSTDQIGILQSQRADLAVMSGPGVACEVLGLLCDCLVEPVVEDVLGAWVAHVPAVSACDEVFLLPWVAVMMLSSIGKIESSMPLMTSAPAAGVLRVVRWSARYEETVTFYRDAIELPVLETFQARSALEVLIFPERTRCLPRAPRHAASRGECSPGRSRSSHLHRRLPGRNDLRYAEKLRITRGIHAS